MTVFFLDEDSIRRQQSQALANACLRLRDTMVEDDFEHAPAHSCIVVADALCEALEGAGVRFADRDAAAANLTVALWEGMAVISADAQRDDDGVSHSPVFPWLAPVVHALAAINDSVASTAPIPVDDRLRARFREQLAAEAD